MYLDVDLVVKYCRGGEDRCLVPLMQGLVNLANVQFMVANGIREIYCVPCNDDLWKMPGGMAVDQDD